MLFDQIAAGGMATVYLGRLMGPAGFTRTVAIKQLHAQYARSPEFVAQFLDEARLSARIRHPNVAAMLDIVAKQGELFVVMEYVQGETLSRVSKTAGALLPIRVAAAVMIQTLLGLHAAHEATTEQGEPLELVHRDVSPQNILIGIDGVARLLDFGVAKAAARLHTTETGQIKGKLAYMPPEQLSGGSVDRRTDIFAAGVVLWELVCGRRLFHRAEPGAVVNAVLGHKFLPPSEVSPGIPSALDDVLRRALATAPADRFATALEMATAIEEAVDPLSPLRVAAWMQQVAGPLLAERASIVRNAEETSSSHATADKAGLQRALGELTRPSSVPAPDSRSHPRLQAVSSNKSSAATAPALPVVPGRKRTRARAVLALAALITTIALTAVLSVFGSGNKESLKPAAVSLSELKVTSPLPPPATVNLVEASSLAALPPPPILSALPVTRRPPPLIVAAPKARKPDCSTPYVLNADGSKRFKPECFR